MLQKNNIAKKKEIREIAKGAISFLLIVITNIFVYYGSFTHIFRHDDWNYWYHTRGVPFGIRYILKFYSFDLYSLDPILSIAFRPLALIFFGFQKFFFGSNYVYFHIFTFILHIAILYSLLKILLEINRSFLAYLFVLLFSILSTGFDLVIWPNNNFYLLQILLMLVSIYLAIRYKRYSGNNNKLLSLIVLLQLPIVFFNELGLFFTAFLSIFILLYNKKKHLLKGDYFKSLYFAIPLLIYLILYLIYRKYGFKYPIKDYSYNTFINIKVFLLAKQSTIFAMKNFFILLFFPSALKPWFYDSVWFYFDRTKLDVANIFLGVSLILLIFNTLSFRKIKDNKAIILFLSSYTIIFLFITSIGRVVTSPVFYVGSVCRFAYIFNVFFCIIAYSLIDLQKLKTPLKLAGTGLIFILVILHSGIIVENVGQISRLLSPLKPYFDQVYNFVNSKKGEKDFSFAVVNLPPQITFANWWGEGYKRCIEGHFYKYLNYNNPKYTLKYDYNEQIFTVYVKSPPAFDK